MEPRPSLDMKLVRVIEDSHENFMLSGSGAQLVETLDQLRSGLPVLSVKAIRS